MTPPADTPRKTGCQAKTIEQPEPLPTAKKWQPLLAEDDENRVENIPPTAPAESIEEYTQERIMEGIRYATTRLKSLYMLPTTKKLLLSYSSACETALEAPDPKNKQELLNHDKKLHTTPSLTTDPVGSERSMINAVAASRERHFVSQYRDFLPNSVDATTIGTDFFCDGLKWVDFARCLFVEEAARGIWKGRGGDPRAEPEMPVSCAIMHCCLALEIDAFAFFDIVKLRAA